MSVTAGIKIGLEKQICIQSAAQVPQTPIRVILSPDPISRSGQGYLIGSCTLFHLVALLSHRGAVFLPLHSCIL